MSLFLHSAGDWYVLSMQKLQRILSDTDVKSEKTTHRTVHKTFLFSWCYFYVEKNNSDTSEQMCMN